MAEPLHVTNGDAVALRETGLEGSVLVWGDVLHAGPLAYEPAESRCVRAAFLAEHGWGDPADIEAGFERRDARLAASPHTVLWFEHDLFDQLQLLQALSQAPAGAVVELVQADDYLGHMQPEELEALWPARRELSAEARLRAARAWAGVIDGDLDQDVPELLYVGGALRRLAEEREPLPRTKRQILELLTGGAQPRDRLFVLNAEREEAMFLGDTWFFLLLDELEWDGLVRGRDPVELTAAGRAFLP